MMTSPQSPRVAPYAQSGTAQLSPRAPFHFDGTFRKPSHLPTTLYRWSPGVFYQTMRVGSKLVGVRIRDRGRRTAPRLGVAMFYSERLSAEDRRAVLNELVFRYALDADLSSFRTKTYRDEQFRTLFRRWMGTRASTPYSLYELLVIGLVLQNTQAKRSVQMLEALLARFGTKVRFDGVELDAIWEPATLSGVTEDELRGLRIGYRAKILSRFSQQFDNHEIDETTLRMLDDLALRDALLSVYGVGPETTRILATEVFHRHAAFTHVAPWQAKIYSRLFYGKPAVAADKILRDVTRRFGEYSALAVHYIWEDLFWKRTRRRIDWLEAEIRL